MLKTRPGAEGGPSDEEGLKRSHSEVEDGEKGAALGLSRGGGQGGGGWGWDRG
jgi:hypothetical protein